MSKVIEGDNEERRKRIAEWQKQGADLTKGRKARNQALIHMGLAVLNMIEKRELDKEKVLAHVVENKTSLVRKTIEAEEVRRLF